MSLPNTTVSSGYLAYTPNDATAAAAITLVQSGTPAAAIGQAINDAYNAISAAPTQEAILATAATNAAATAAALMAQETAANTAAQAAAAAIADAAVTAQAIAVANSPSEAPGNPDLRAAEQGTLSQPGVVVSGSGGAFGSFSAGSIYSTSYETLSGTGSVVRANNNGTTTACEPFSTRFQTGVRDCKTTRILIQPKTSAPASESTEQATLAKWTEWDNVNPVLSGSVNAGNPNAYNSNITGLQVVSLDGKGPQVYTGEAICQVAGTVSIVFPTDLSAKDWAVWTGLTPGLTALAKLPVSVLKSAGSIATTAGIWAAPIDVLCRLTAARTGK